jgi:GNAT superfamily N-acetyltransferase
VTPTVIRPAAPGDAGPIVEMVHQLADFERAPDQCTLTEPALAAALFGPDPVAGCHVGQVGDEVAAMALWFRNFSTWDGVAGIHLEDLFVRPQFRRRGLARALLAALARECLERGYSRLGWSVLDWNAGAIAFYESVGARPMPEWIGYRVDGPALSALTSWPLILMKPKPRLGSPGLRRLWTVRRTPPPKPLFLARCRSVGRRATRCSPVWTQRQCCS